MAGNAWIAALLVACSGKDGTSDLEDTDGTVDTVDTVDTTPTGTITGTDYAIYYVGWSIPGIDQRYPVSATVVDGAMQIYVAGPDEAPEIGSCTAVDVGSHRSATWGRWADGTTAGNYYGQTLSFGPNGGWHYVLLDTPMTGGSFGVAGTYTQVGATAVTAKSDGPVGTTTWEATVVPGDPPGLAFSMTSTIGGVTTTAATPGYPDTVNSGITWYQGSFAGGMDATGCPDPASCAVGFRGRWADGGETIGLLFSHEPVVGGVVTLAAP